MLTNDISTAYAFRLKIGSCPSITYMIQCHFGGSIQVLLEPTASTASNWQKNHPASLQAPCFMQVPSPWFTTCCFPSFPHLHENSLSLSNGEDMGYSHVDVEMNGSFWFILAKGMDIPLPFQMGARHFSGGESRCSARTADFSLRKSHCRFFWNL